MGRLKCAIDTSAAISLGSTSNFKTAAKFFSFVSTGMINNELIEISKTADKIGNIANNILKSSIIKFLKLEKELQNNRGEVEVINLANKIKADFVLMDDIQARKKLQKQCNVPIRFSPFIIFTFYEKIYDVDIEEVGCAGTDTACGFYPNCANCNSQDGFSSGNYCSGNNVVRDYRDGYCAANVCVSQTTHQVQQSCNSNQNCENAQS